MSGTTPYHLIVVAGGSGQRMGAEVPKQFLPLAGRPIVAHTLAAFHSWRPTLSIVLVLPQDHIEYWQALVAELNFIVPHRVVAGGASRFASVQCGVKALGQVSGIVGVHDGVRPLVRAEVMARCFKAAVDRRGAVPVVPVIDSLRQVSDSSSEIVDRSAFVRVQTPQCFQAEILWDAYAQSEQAHFTDSASVVESLGHKVALVEGDERNIKVTTPSDLIVAEALLAQLI